MSAHIAGPVVCDWCGRHLLPLTSYGNDRFYHEKPGDPGLAGIPYCPHDGKYYQVDWILHIVSEVK
jgi:hypothetical protein